MEISDVVNTQFAFPVLVVGLVLTCAVLVFVFGFKSVEDFPFDKLGTVADDRKPAGKKRKVKDKKSQSNGQATVLSETKQKNSENTGTKVPTNKIKVAEKSPAKDTLKAANKQEKKQGKSEASPVKVALKDMKNIKETNKISEDGQKQDKSKEEARKQQKNLGLQQNKQYKNKGKENVEVKNKKNVEKSKKKIEETPKDFDEGEWEQAFSRKDKKSRKPVLSDEDNIAEKSVKTEVASPGKKKKSKAGGELTLQAGPGTTPASQTDVVSEPPKEANLPKKKEKEQKKENIQPVEEAHILESAAPNIESEGEGKTAKKKKKKAVAKENSEPVPSTVDEKIVVDELAPLKSAEPKKVEEPQTTTGPVFDELGDTWKEAKTQKKASKKKVRKVE